MNDPDLVDLQDVDRVAALLGAGQGVMEGADAENRDAFHLVLARSLDHERVLADPVQVGVVGVVVADCHDVRVDPRQARAQ